MLLERQDDDFVIVHREVVSEREWPTTAAEERELLPPIGAAGE